MLLWLLYLRYAITNVAIIVVITVIIYEKDTLPCNERLNFQWFKYKFSAAIMIRMYNVLTYWRCKYYTYFINEIFSVIVILQ